MLYYFSFVSALSLLPLLTVAKPTPTSTCKTDKVVKAITTAPSGEGLGFCSELLISASTIGTLDYTITIPVYTTTTDPSSTDPVTKFVSKGTKTVITRTTYASQASRTPNPTKFTRPLPSYIEQYPTPRVRSACSCLVPDPLTYTIYRRCDILSSTSTSYTTLTYTTGVPGSKTKTYKYTDTTTKYRATTSAYPTSCPDAGHVPYIAADGSTWDRRCGTYISRYRELKDVKADSFDACIDKCVAYNKKEGYSQCQGVAFYDGTTCSLYNEPGYLDDAAGAAAVATLSFYEPETTESDYCAALTPTA
ncbi:MAG: hypothetical protein LQ342_003333 [Letrouitia transgressa]|nr:MAG: hypothetical protein LQ342_003333 [Letrouitia transgressa]